MRQPENAVFRDYFSNLYHFYEDYLAQWPFLREICGNLKIGRFNLNVMMRDSIFKKRIQKEATWVHYIGFWLG